MSRQELFERTWKCLILALLLGVMSYLWVDRAVVLWLSAHHSREWFLVKFLHPVAEFPGWFVDDLIFPCYLYLGIRLIFGSLSTTEKNFALFLTILVIAHFGFLIPLKNLCGRPWADTFYGNPSFLKNGLYGFYLGFNHPLFQSFPSGHSLNVLVLTTFSWYYARAWRWWCFLYAVFVISMMIVQYYHFVSDSIAGAALGYLIVLYIQFYDSCRYY